MQIWVITETGKSKKDFDSEVPEVEFAITKLFNERIKWHDPESITSQIFPIINPVINMYRGDARNNISNVVIKSVFSTRFCNSG